MNKNMKGCGVKDQVEAWIKSEGFALEMRVAKMFQASCAVVDQSQYYMDPTTDKMREIDVVARHIALIGGAMVEFIFVVECKSSKDKPWVLFTHEGPRSFNVTLATHNRLATTLGDVLLLELSTLNAVQVNFLFRQPTRIAHGVTCAFQNNKDVAYAAVQGALSAATSVVDHSEQPKQGLSERKAIQIVWPVVVVDGLLFESYLTDQGKVVVGEVDLGALLQLSTAFKGGGCWVDIVPLKKLPVFIEEMDRAWKELVPIIENDTKTMKQIVKGAMDR